MKRTKYTARQRAGIVIGELAHALGTLPDDAILELVTVLAGAKTTAHSVHFTGAQAAAFLARLTESGQISVLTHRPAATITRDGSQTPST
jgi:hypothetical protein